MKGWWPILVVALAGCGSFEDDMEMICGVEARAKEQVGDMKNVDPSQHLTIYAAFIEENVKTDEGRAVLEGLRQKDHDAKLDVVRKAMKKAGRSDCALIGALERSAEWSRFNDDLEALCTGNPKELAKQLAAEPYAPKRVEVRASFYGANLKSEAGKELWATLKDDAKTLPERKKAAEVAAEEKGLSVTSCAYLDEVERARSEESEKLHADALALANAEGDARDLKGALSKFEAACKLGHEQACRQAPLTKALLAGKDE